MTERRKFLRFETTLNGLCEVINQQRKASSKIKNISKEGALIVLNQKLKEGEELNLSVDVPGDNIPIFATCEVAWQKTPNKSNGYETGVKFTRIENLDKGRLLEYIYLQWLRFMDKK